jgi:hypothetical protein
MKSTKDREPNSYVNTQDEFQNFLDERERNLIDKGLYPDNPPSNFNPFIENMAKITKDPLEQNSKFLEKYFKSMN